MKLLCKRTVCLLLALVLCAGLLPTLGASAASMEERQQALLAVMWAYYDKGSSTQYDGTVLVENINRADVGQTRSTNQVAPEYATPNETMFSVCSDYAHQVYWETFRYQLTGHTAGHCWTGSLLDIGSEQDEIPNNPICVFHWGDDKDKKMPIREAIDEILRICQVGDVITVMRDNGHGHTMLYAGDAVGDGKAYLLHSTGSHMDAEGGKDNREYKTKDDPTIDERVNQTFLPDSNGGTVCLSEAEKTLRERYEVTGAAVRFNVLRPLISMSESEYPITPATKYRMSHPRLAIDRTLNLTRMNSAYTGEVVTMTLKLSNFSTVDYSVPVSEKAPAGAKIKTPFEGAKLSGDTMKLDVALKAGESKTLTAEYEITAPRGEIVNFDGGAVGDIPSNSIRIPVGGKKLTDAEKAKLLAVNDYHKQLSENKVPVSGLGNYIYQKVLGLNVKLPDHRTVATKLIKKAKTPSGKDTYVFLPKEEVAAENLTVFQTLVPTFRAGTNMWIQWGIDRCTDPRDKYLEPGDVIVRSDNFNTSVGSEQLVYLGNGKYLSYNASKKAYTVAEEPEFFKCLTYKVFYVLRPTLAYDDIHALGAPAKEFKFTDVKEADWFYTYVKDLVEDGTVNGMTETTFVPNGTLTYGQALKLIALAVGEKEPAKSGTHWASGYLTLAKEKKWLDGDVNLDGTITRLALCKIAAKAKRLSEQPATNPFKDTSDKDVLALNKAGVINGMTATEFQPNGLLTRAQISKIIWTLRKV